MSVFAGHDISLNKYHYVFYSFSKSEPNTLKAQFYDSGQNLLFHIKRIMRDKIQGIHLQHQPTVDKSLISNKNIQLRFLKRVLN